MGLVLGVLAGAVLLMTALLWVCLAATLYHFRLRPRQGARELLPMTVIKPVRGLDDAIEEGFASLITSDPQGKLQLIIALESAEDPAYPVARAFAERNPGRDILVLITGPHGRRMGKIHNMLEALPRARHPAVVFSDADTLGTPELLSRTSRAFEEGYEGVFTLPTHPPGRGLGSLLYQIAFNHSFSLPAALSFYAGQMRLCAGAWMGFTREALERMGGLEPISRLIAEDVALAAKAREKGLRTVLLGEFVWVRESGASLRETLAHLAKWMTIMRWCFPAAFLLLPVLNLGVLSLLLWVLCESSGEAWGLWIVALALGSRVAVGVLQDRLAGPAMAWYQYPLLALVDLGAALFWPAGLRSEVLWRGIRYRLGPGGAAEVLPDEKAPPAPP